MDVLIISHFVDRLKKVGAMLEVTDHNIIEMSIRSKEGKNIMVVF